MKNVKENSPLKDLCPEKKITNHNANKIVVKKFKSSGVPRCKIENITGHTTAHRFDDYHSGDKREQKVIGNLTDNSRPYSSRGILSQLYPANSSALTASTTPGQICNFSHRSGALNIAGDNSTQKSSSISWAKRGYKRIFIEDSHSD